jgi:hypothetical protein
MIKRFIQEAPRDLEEAAMIDGSSQLPLIRIVTLILTTDHPRPGGDGAVLLHLVLGRLRVRPHLNPEPGYDDTRCHREYSVNPRIELE